MKYSLSKVLLASILVLPWPKLFASADWELVSDKDGIKLYSKDIPGSDLVAFKGIKTLPIPIAKLAELVMDKDNERKKRWIDMSREFKVLEGSEAGFVFYVDYDLPWPAADRDFIVDCRMTIDTEAREVAFELKSTEHPVDAVPHAVRAELIKSVYKLVAKSPDATEVTAEIQADPRGILPKWLVNFIQKDWPTKTLQKMEIEAKAPDLKDHPLVKEQITFDP